MITYRFHVKMWTFLFIFVLLAPLCFGANSTCWDNAGYSYSFKDWTQPADVKPGETVNFYMNATDKDHYITYDSNNNKIEEGNPESNLTTSQWFVISPSNSTIKDGVYLAGNQWPSEVSLEIVGCIIDDPLDQKGTPKDDPAYCFVFHTFKDKFPWNIKRVNTDPVKYGVGTAWTQTHNWKVLDQWESALDGVGIEEKPTTWCTTVAGHDARYHLSGVTTTGDAETKNGGFFKDTFGASYQPIQTANVTKQNYKCTYGTFRSPTGPFLTVKIIHWRDQPSTVIHFETPENLPTTQQLCTTND